MLSFIKNEANFKYKEIPGIRIPTEQLREKIKKTATSSVHKNTGKGMLLEKQGGKA